MSRSFSPRHPCITIGKPIPLGSITGPPVSIGVNTNSSNISRTIIYVADATDNAVSVIGTTNITIYANGTTNTVIGKPIPVGKYPLSIGVNTDPIYVVNREDSTVSVIDGEANKVVARVMFNIEPLNAGHIECDGTTIAPVAQQFYVYSGTECTAVPEPGFEFDSWREDLGHNSTQLISLVPPPSIVDSILDSLHISHDKPQSRLTITKFGTFVANFKAPPAPDIYVVTLFTVVATALIGSWTFIGSTIIQKRKAKTQLKYFKECIGQIGKPGIDKNALEDKIIGYYADGKLSDVHHQLLNDKISDYYEDKGSGMI
jgi:YVTN family beta-propeller protein